MKFIFGWVLKRPRLGFFLALLVSLIGLLPGLKIPIRLSLLDLLPEQRESVRDSKFIASEVGGTGFLVVIVGPTDQPEQYLPTLHRRFEGFPKVRYTYFERETFTMRDRAPYLLPPSEFKSLLSSTETLVFKGKAGGFLDLGFGDDAEASQKVDEAKAFFAQFRAKHSSELPAQGSLSDRFFLSRDGQYATFWIKPDFDASVLNESAKLTEQVELQVHQALPPSVPFRLWGRYINNVREVKRIESDIATTSAFSTLAVLVVLALGLGSIRSALISVWCVAVSMGWTLGFAQLFVGQINIVTGFLLAILGGLGVEYGVHLIRRFYQERKEGSNAQKALETVYWNTGGALFSAAMTSAGAFLILAISDFRAFSELGWIAGFGILAIYLTYMLSFPFLARWIPEKVVSRRFLRVVGYYPFRGSWSWIIPLVIVAAAFGIKKVRFEYDFQKMRELSKEGLAADALINEMMHNRTTTPLAILARDSEQARQVQEWLSEAKQKEVVQNAYYLGNLQPPDMKERYASLQRFRDKARQLPDETIRSATGLEAATVRRWLESKPYGRADLPPQFRDAFGRDGNIVLVYSGVSLNTFDGISRITGVLREAKKQFQGLRVGGDTVIFKEILEHIFLDGREVLALFFLGAFAVLWFEFRSFKDAVELELQLLLGIFLLVGAMGLLDVPFSIVNIGMMPAVLASGIDIGVHVRHREREVGARPLDAARFVAQAVQLSVLTTLIGFASLFWADASMLKGIAWISVLGQSSMYFVCMFAWPVGKTWLAPKRPTGQLPKAHH